MDLTMFTNPTVTICLAAAVAVSEALSLIPSVKSNGIFQLVFNVLKKLTGTAVVAFLLMFCMVALTACTTLNMSIASGERASVKAADNDTPSTTVSTTASIPLK